MPYLKAIVAALSAFVASLVAATVAGDGINQNEWLTAFAALLGSGFLVYLAPNRPPTE